jgi:hypothetical protein
MDLANEVPTHRLVIRQVDRVWGKSIVLRNVQVEDAEFILSLRLDPQKGSYLSPVEADVDLFAVEGAGLLPDLRPGHAAAGDGAHL